MPVDFDPLYPIPAKPEFLSAISILGPQLNQKLHRIISALAAAIPGFPNTRCVETATFIASELGLHRVSGQYVDPNPDHGNQKFDHCWNRTSDGRYYIDITHQQFDPSAPAITILPADNPILVSDEKVAQRIELYGYKLPDEIIRRIRMELGE